jgi:hypothetical protein
MTMDRLFGAPWVVGVPSRQPGKSSTSFGEFSSFPSSSFKVSLYRAALGSGTLRVDKERLLEARRKILRNFPFKNQSS